MSRHALRGKRYLRRAMIVVALCMCLLTPQTASGAPDVSRREAIKAYAPLVYITTGPGDARERHLPMDARTFVRESNLRWSHAGGVFGGCDHQVAGHGPKPRLGSKSNPYRHRQGCDHDEGSFTSTQYTRPRDGNDRRVTHGTEGFFLDPDEDILGGTGTSAPVYYQFEAQDFITYWFFYPYSEPFGRGENVFAHQGDWERITVKLDNNNRATHVAYFSHDGYCVQRYREPGARYRGHPRVYVAHGSHASYPRPGRYGTDVADDDGPRWRTYRKLRNVENETFYGFGGAWGEVGNFGNTTGPLGPSVHKPPEPGGDWANNGDRC